MRKTSLIAIVLAVAVVAAGGGYALGTQTGGGTAGAAGARPGAPAGRPGAPARAHHISALARRLGVDRATLRDAVRTLRARRIAARRRARAAGLARILGVPRSRVESALAATRGRRAAASGRRRPRAPRTP
jgi:hypothetical protein